MYIYVRDIDFPSVPTIFLLDFGAVLKVSYFLYSFCFGNIKDRLIDLIVD